MSERRSGRSQKRVDYSKFSNEENFSDSDDDFANPTPPPAKKAKTAKEPKKPKSSDKIKVTPDIAIRPAEPKPRTGVATKRMAPEEKAFQRELELAMEMSMTEDCPPPVLTPAEEVAPPGENKENQQTTNHPSVPPVLVEADKIEILEENVSDSENKGRSRRKSANKSAKKIVESDDDEDDFMPDESSDDDDDSDNDFKLPCESDSDDGRKKSKNNKKTKTPTSSKKVQKTSTPKTNTKPVSKVSGTKPVNNKSKNSSNISSSRNTTGRQGPSPLTGRSMTSPVPRTNISSPTLPASLKKTPGGKTGSLTPALPRQPASSSVSSAQGNHLGGVSIKSPSGGAGVLRLGLSRRARITPLHSAAKQPS